MSALKPIKEPTEFELSVASMIAQKFPDAGMFGVIEERRLYNPQTVEYIWQQNKDMIPHVAEVSYRGEYLCDVNNSMQPKEAFELIRDRLIKLLSKKNGT